MNGTHRMAACTTLQRQSNATVARQLCAATRRRLVSWLDRLQIMSTKLPAAASRPCLAHTGNCAQDCAHLFDAELAVDVGPKLLQPRLGAPPHRRQVCDVQYVHLQDVRLIVRAVVAHHPVYMLVRGSTSRTTHALSACIACGTAGAQDGSSCWCMLARASAHTDAKQRRTLQATQMHSAGSRQDQVRTPCGGRRMRAEQGRPFNLHAQAACRRRQPCCLRLRAADMCCTWL